MLFLLGGLAILCGVLLLGYVFVHADPAKLARNLKWIGLGIAVAVGLALVVLSEGRVAIFLAPLIPLVPVWRRLRSWLGGVQGPAAGRSSTVETAFLRMSLDHDTGGMAGTVMQGRFAGMRLDELNLADLLTLLRECRARDEEGARLLEAYLDRSFPDWHDGLHGEEAGTEPPGAAADMTVAEAYAVLGLGPGADESAIRAAHHRLMKQLHPDHGGSDYLATKINRARDVLLHH